MHNLTKLINSRHGSVMVLHLFIAHIKNGMLASDIQQKTAELLIRGYFEPQNLRRFLGGIQWPT